MTHIPELIPEVPEPLIFPTSAFGEILVAAVNVQVSMLFSFGLHPAIGGTRLNGGTATEDQGALVLNTGAAANQSAELRSRNPIRYIPGLGGVVRFTAGFTGAVEGSLACIGLGDQGNHICFACKDGQCGYLRRAGGEPEVRSLTITTGSTTVENATVTLDGVAELVPITNPGNITATANEIADHDYGNVGRGWTAFVRGSMVTFVSWAAGPKSGAYSIAGTTVVGGFAQDIAGINFVTEVFVPQTEWNLDKADGTGTLPEIQFDSGLPIPMQILYQFLGYGAIELSIENPETGRFVPVHIEKHAGTSINPSLANPSLPLMALVENTTNTGEVTLRTGSMMGGNHGLEVIDGPRDGVEQLRVGLNSSDGEVPIMTIFNKIFYQGRLNRNKVKISIISPFVEHTKPVILRFYSNLELVDAAPTSVGPFSLLEVDIAATDFTPGELKFPLTLEGGNTEIIQLIGRRDGELPPGSSFTVTAEVTSANGAEVHMGFDIINLF